MDFRDGTRAQSIQLGAILLFGILIIFAAGYQAFAVPGQNAGVEFDHSQQVQGELQETRGAIHITGATGSTRPATVTLGTTYPPRTLFVNPPPTSGTLETAGSNGVTIENAEAIDAETRDFWDGTPATNYETQTLRYSPNYNQLEDPPTTVYQSGILFNRFDDGTTLAVDESFIQGNQISLVFLDGEYQESGTAAKTIEPQPLSERRNTIAVRNTTNPISVTVPMELPNGTVGEGGTVGALLEDEMTANGGHVTAYDCANPDPCNELTVELEQGITYQLKMAKVGIGSGATTPGAAYVTDTSGNASAVPEGGRHPITIEARDKYNNPISGSDVRAEIETDATFAGDTIQSTTATTDDNGRARFVYVPPDDFDTAAVGDNTETITVHVAFDGNLTGCNQNSDTCAVFEIYVLNADGS